MEYLQSEIIPKKRLFFILTHTGVNQEEFKKNNTIAEEFINNLPSESETIISQYSNYLDSNTVFVPDNEPKINCIPNLNSALLSVQQKIEFIFNKEISVVLFSNGPCTDDPKATITSIMDRGIKFFCITTKNEALVTLASLSTNISFHVYENSSKLTEYIKEITKNKIEIPVLHKISVANQTIQTSKDDLSISFKIFLNSNEHAFKENEIEIEILTNDYYYGQKVIVPNKVDCNTPYIAHLVLRVANNSSNYDLPSKIYFKIKVKEQVFDGFFTLDLVWFTGDFETLKPINIWVEGLMGNGKSSVLNMLFNLFTSNPEIYDYFISSNYHSHVTKKISFSKISDILDVFKGIAGANWPLFDKIKDKIKISLVDKPGITNTDANISFLLASKGAYHNNTHKDQMVASNKEKKEYECHAVIFVVSLSEIFANKAEMELVKKKTEEVIDKVNIQPILAVTFSDNFTETQLEAAKKQLYKCDLNVAKNNIFFVHPYINGETKRKIEKDIEAFKLLKYAVKVGIQKQFQKEMDSKDIQKKQRESDSNEATTTLNDASTSTPNEPATTNPIGSVTKKTFAITLIHEGNDFKIKVPQKYTVTKLYGMAKKKFSIKEDFSLNDEDDVELVGDFPLDDVIFEEESRFKVNIKKD
ncbi:hypothetical protein DICPUDRAFT_158492 [Dictyostelium purpureum]|uniref:Uncharacterized protein n=1 Tax=Dictyostelium purpureum TaxID=5786 RepID=F1A1R2_DICPU|nr:uncharacterized protein DICPUDRAFT_158492 [Dictyostelium purpureum]EGC29871.1 hypothetical protein DICPUDRAFT_158492 [Dictyostelium purpureum]|eukprot:XP_003293608.1 hypothetical protein DICPUDRAFT_158492 [Dictyostelium purpureum]